MRPPYKYFLPLFIGLVLFGRLTLSSYVLCVNEDNAATIEYSVGTDCAEKTEAHEVHAFPVLEQVHACQDWALSPEIVQVLPSVPQMFYAVAAYVAPRPDAGVLGVSIARMFELRTPTEQSLERQISATILVI